MDTTPQEKICTKCHQSKSLDEFPNKKGGKYGKDSRCYACAREYRLAYDAANWDKIVARNAAYHEERFEEHKIRDAIYRKNNKEKIQAKNKRLYEKQKAESTRWQDRFPEQKKASDRASYHKHIDERQAYREKNKAKRSQQAKEWAENNQDHVLEYRREHRQETKLRVQKWAKDFPERNAAREQRRRARKNNLPDTWTPTELEFMLRYWHDSCAVCGNTRGFFWTLAHDHWIPIASPDCPGTVATNMLPLCHGEGGCNNSKNKTEPHAWLIRRFDAKKVVKIEKAIAAYFHLVSETFTKKGA